MKVIKPGDMRRSCMYCGAQVELNLEDIKALLSNLTGCDGKIREAVAHTINRLLKEDNW